MSVAEGRKASTTTRVLSSAELAEVGSSLGDDVIVQLEGDAAGAVALEDLRQRQRCRLGKSEGPHADGDVEEDLRQLWRALLFVGL